MLGSALDAASLWANEQQVVLIVISCQVKSSQVSAHSLQPLLASGAHSIGFRTGFCSLVRASRRSCHEL
jgi:hypothetical protein